MTARTTRPRRTQPRTKATVAAITTDVEPLRFYSDTPTDSEDRIVAFYLDDVPYSVPRVVSPSVALRFLKLARTGGNELAMAELLEDMLGAEAYDALASYKGLTAQNMTDLMNLVQRHAMGALDDPKGNSRSA